MISKFNLEYSIYGEHAILIEWPNKICPEILDNILAFDHVINTQIKDELIETVTAYNSLTVFLKSLINTSDMISLISGLYEESCELTIQTKKLWKIPVCYDLDFGIDLNEMSNKLGLSVQQIIKLHTSKEYLVYFVGFLPGFLYLGGLNDQIHFPRRTTPRVLVDKGAVAIGGQQTGIYPKSSPAGWQIIGNSPIEIFNTSNEIPCFIDPGDKIKFYGITKDEHRKIKSEVKQGTFKLNHE